MYKLAKIIWEGMKLNDEWEDLDAFTQWLINQYKYNFYNPNGEIVGSNNLSQLCKDNDLSYKSMLCVNNGTAKTHKGWYKDLVNKPTNKVYYVFAPNHEFIEIHNLSVFCREHGLGYQSMLKVLNGSQQTHKGWYK